MYKKNKIMCRIPEIRLNLLVVNEKNIIDDAYLDNVSMCEKRTLVLDKFDKSTMSNAYYLMYKEL